jgi:SAM-dependent methyltransferase
VVQLFVGFAYLNWGATDWGADLRAYVDASRMWLRGDGFYLPRQLHGPYQTELGDILYPPTALYLFLPFVVLPAQLWWILATGLLAVLVWSWRPAAWAVAAILVCCAYPNNPLTYLRGAPVIVFAALVGAALRWKWPGALILLKPSIFPFALIGVRTRGWWLTAALLLILTLPLISLVPDWLHAVVDSRGYGGLLYSARDLPLLLIPVFAFIGRTREPTPLHMTFGWSLGRGGPRRLLGDWHRLGGMMELHDHAAHGIDIEPGSLAWSEWVKDYYRDVETYDWVDVADNLRGPEAFFHRNRARVVRQLTARYAVPGGPILDAGCGTGLNLRHLPPGSTGIDINPRNVEIVQKRLPGHRVVEGDIEAMPFADGAFATVLCTEVLEHVPDPAAALREYRRVLQPGGVLIGSVPARSAIWKLRFLSSTCPHSEPFHNEYLPEEVRAMLEGWTVLHLGYSLLHFNVMFVARRDR